MLRVLEVLAVDQIRELETQVDEVEEAHLELETCRAEELLQAVLLCHCLCGSRINTVVSCIQVVSAMPSEIEEDVQAREDAIHEELGTGQTEIDVCDCTEIRVVAVGVDSTDLAAEGDRP